MAAEHGGSASGAMILHGYYRSSASWRVRIALAIKGLEAECRYIHLRHGEQRDEAYRKVNPQGLVPALEVDGVVLTQSLAICEYLDEVHPDPPLLPRGAHGRAAARAFAQVIACDIHPLQNLSVLQHLRALGLDDGQVTHWARDVIERGLDACSRLIEDGPAPYCFGDTVTLADLCLVPQLYNARRFGVELRWPRLLAIEAACLQLPAFRDTAPEAQADAE